MSAFLAAEWRNLVLLNYEIDPAILRPLIPVRTELDPYQGRHYVSLVGFQFLKTRVLGLPIPFHCNFEEINLRFYVRHQAADGWRRGVVFIREIVPRWAIAAVARWVYNEQYVAHPMHSRVLLPASDKPEGLVEYGWQALGRAHRMQAEFSGTPSPLQAGSEEEYITEHYWGYTVQRDGSSLQYRVEHPPWRVWRAKRSQMEVDVAGFYGSQYVEALSCPPTSAFVAEGSPIRVHKGERIPGHG